MPFNFSELSKWLKKQELQLYDTTRFPKFQELPTELRALVWREAVSSLPPRIIEFQWNRTLTEQGINQEIIRTDVRSPALLSACTGSRAEALKRYIPLRHCHLTRCYPYFDPAVDTIFFSASFRQMKCKCCKRRMTGRSAFSEIMVEQLWSKVQHLALQEPLLKAFMRSAAVSSCKNLHEVTIVPCQISRLNDSAECYKNSKWRRDTSSTERFLGLVQGKRQCDRHEVSRILRDITKEQARTHIPNTVWASTHPGSSVSPGFNIMFLTRGGERVIDWGSPEWDLNRTSRLRGGA